MNDRDASRTESGALSRERSNKAFNATLIAALLLALTILPVAGAASSAPNILVLIAEDMSAKVGAFADPQARTPHLDRLAGEGVRFPNTFTTAGVCAPSRAAFITGVHQVTLGAMHMRTSTSPLARYMAVPPPEVKAFPELLRQAGYYTFTDRKLDYQFSGIFAGTGPETIWDEEGPGVSLESIPSEQPFFGLINFLITHESAGFLAGDVTSPRGRAVAEQAEAARSGLREHTNPAEIKVPPYYPDEPQVREHIADHYDNIQLMDAQVGGLVRQLEALGRLDNTIIIWTADHGDALPRAKRELYDSGIRVPMIIRWPRALLPSHFESGHRDNRLISFVDLAPVILAMAGVSEKSFHQGRDRLRANAEQRRYIYASRDRMDEQQDRVRAVRDERFKYLRFYQPGTPGAVHLDYRDQGRIMQSLWQGRAAGTLTPPQNLWFEPRPAEALYDLQADPHELIDLSDDPGYLPVLSRMRSAYGEWRLRIPDLGDVPEAELAQRFWPEAEQPITEAPTFEQLADGRIALHSTEGASMEQNTGEGWRLYSGPIELKPGTRLEGRAVRYGYALSRVSSFPPP